jgi:hypothetical protein
LRYNLVASKGRDFLQFIRQVIADVRKQLIDHELKAGNSTRALGTASTFV